jgi:uroporphyrinogen-III synthase
VTPVHVYDYGAIADPSAVNTLVTKILKGEIQVIAFTSAPQVRMLFDLGRQLGIADSLNRALKSNVVIASIGEVTNRALGEQGLAPKIVPKQSKMGSMAQAVGEFFSSNPSPSGRGLGEGRRP